MNGERTPGTKNDDSSEFPAQDENNSKKRFSSMREGVSGVLVDVRTDRPPEIENGQEENMIDEKKLLEKLEDMAKESKEESGLKEPALLQKVMDEVRAMAVNEEIRQRIEREDASSMKYRKKPVVIEAFKYDGDLKGSDGQYYVPDWAIKAYEDGTMCYGEVDGQPGELFIKTLEGVHHARVGDYIIKGVKGELYPCKPEIFEQTYEKVEE